MAVELSIILRERMRDEEVLLVRREMVHFVVRVQIVPADLAVLLGRAVARVAAARDRFFHRGGFRPVFIVPDVPVLHVVAQPARGVGGVRPGVVRARVEPAPDDFLLILRHVDALVVVFDEAEQFAVSRSDLVRVEIAHRPVSIVAEHFAPRHLHVAERVERVPVPGAVETALFAVGIVALDAVFVEDRLNVPREAENVRHARDFFGIHRRVAQDLGNAFTLVRARGFGPFLVAADADRVLARHHRGERVHALHAVALFVQRDEQERAARGEVEVRPAVFRHGDAPVQTLDREGPERGDLFHPA